MLNVRRCSIWQDPLFSLYEELVVKGRGGVAILLFVLFFVDVP